MTFVASKDRKSYQRSRAGNGNALFVDSIDGRTATARRYREILAGIEKDLGGKLTQAQDIFARRAATLSVWCEKAEAQMVSGGEFDQNAFLTATNSLRRLLQDLGLTHDSDPVELVRASRVRNAVQREIRRMDHEPS